MIHSHRWSKEMVVLVMKTKGMTELVTETKGMMRLVTETKGMTAEAMSVVVRKTKRVATEAKVMAAEARSAGATVVCILHCCRASGVGGELSKWERGAVEQAKLPGVCCLHAHIPLQCCIRCCTHCHLSTLLHKAVGSLVVGDYRISLIPR